MVSAFSSINFGGYKRGNGEGKVILVCNMSFFGPSSSSNCNSFDRFLNFEPDTDEPDHPETSSGLQCPKDGSSCQWDKKPDDPVSPRKGDNVNPTLPPWIDMPPACYRPFNCRSSNSSGLDSMEFLHECLLTILHSKPLLIGQTSGFAYKMEYSL